MPRFPFALPILFAALMVVDTRAVEPADLFLEQIAPIFERRCIRCHNDTDRKGGLSLQSEQSMRAGSDGGEIVNAHNSAAGLLIGAISGDAPKMPKESHPLTADQVAEVLEWVKGGAKWPAGARLEDNLRANRNWWSLKPLIRPPVPPLLKKNLHQARTLVDHFVIARLQERDMSLSHEADRRTLLRRLSFDLLGLPPTPEQVAAFIADDSPQAYEQLVDRLLASPHYGERWARHWLDVVKYADTCGYDKDKLRPNAWPYRDYVIRSFNEDKPYERFVQEQIAGDVLFPGEPDGILGLGFIAAGPWDFIGHAELPETKIDGRIARHIDRDEMVSNTLNTFNSVTIQCCRCHNHKFDPLTQEHYYSLQAVFAAVDRADRPYNVPPEAEQKVYELQSQLGQHKAELAKLNETVKKEGGKEFAAITKRVAELKPKTNPTAKHPAHGYHSQVVKDATSEKWVQVDLGHEVEVDKVILHACHDDYAGIGAGFGFPVRFRVEAFGGNADLAAAEKAVTLDDQTGRDFPNPALGPYEIKTSGLNVRFIRVTATKLPERQHDFIFALAEIEVFDNTGKNIAIQCNVTAADSIEAPVRWARSNLADGIWPHATDPAALKELAVVQATHRQILARINTPERAAVREQIEEKIAVTTTQILDLTAGRMVYAAATHFQSNSEFKPTMGKPRTIRLLDRGNILTPGDVMRPGTIPIPDKVQPWFELNPDHGEGDRRAALARWLTRHDHPLTWRSIVNRVWLYHFGEGIVATPNDFGRMGKLPSHPELLDWLATEFRDSGQSFKELHRLLVTSAVYRQTSEYHEKHAVIDASNRYLWRMTRRRLEAEEIRDATLAVSGQLADKMGGPGYYLFVLEKNVHSPHYEYHKFDPEDPTSHRRSIYRFIVRSQPDPFMTTLDCADSSQSTPNRNETLTSLQALSLMNNKFILAMSREFGERLQRERPRLPQQIERGMQLVTGRSLTERERQQLEGYARTHGLTSCCRVLLNLSEFCYLD